MNEFCPPEEQQMPCRPVMSIQKHLIQKCLLPVTFQDVLGPLLVDNFSPHHLDSCLSNKIT